jgi:histone H3/H4
MNSSSSSSTLQSLSLNEKVNALVKRASTSLKIPQKAMPSPLVTADAVEFLGDYANEVMDGILEAAIVLANAKGKDEIDEQDIALILGNSILIITLFVFVLIKKIIMNICSEKIRY